MFENKNTYILSLEAKDIINAGIKGYIVNPKKKYKGMMDFSLEVIKLDEVATAMNKDIFYQKDNKQCSDSNTCLE